MDKRKLEKIENDRLIVKDKEKALLYEIERMNDNILTLIEESKKKEELELELSGTDFKGDKGDKGDPGTNGIDGKDGYTPVKGKDYFTKKEIYAIKEEIKPIKGVDYFDGINGDIGPAGKEGSQGLKGDRGDKGDKGEKGDPPKHEIVGNQIRFEKPDGTWGNWIRLNSIYDGQRTVHRGGGISQINEGNGITVATIANNEVTISLDSADSATFAGITSNGELTANKGVTFAHKIITSDYTVSVDDHYISANSSSSLTITMPNPTLYTGKHYSIKNLNEGIVYIAATGGSTIDGETTQRIDYQWTSIDLISNGTNWEIR